jgi:hypothetical protein
MARMAEAGSLGGTTRALVERLERAKQGFTPGERSVKRQALAALADRRILDGRLLLRYHEALGFLRAYPDDAEILRMTEEALEKFGARVEALGAGEAEALAESGVAGTTVYCPLSYPAARWLADRFPDSAEVDWDDPESQERFEILGPLLVDLVSEESLVDVGVPYRAWLAAAKAGDPRSDLGWILDRLTRGSAGADARRALYGAVRLRTRWELRDSPASRTRAHVPARSIFFSPGPLLRWRGRLPRRLPGAPVPVKPASLAEAKALLDVARAAVTVRYREVHAFNFADPAGVVVADAGRGVRVAWFGVLPEHRLPLRAHYGYLLLKNGVPVGYGDASLLFDWCDIAFNIFETFRQGESAFLFARLLAFLCQRFGARAFHLSRYQIGYRNDEAIESGAFWFYYKLGFRPTRPDLRHLAAEERRRVARAPAYRSPRETLERIAQAGMFLDAGARDGRAVRAFEVRRAGLRAAARLAKGSGRARPGSAAEVAAGLARRLGARRWRAWPRAERVALARLAPVLAAIPDLPGWPVRDRRALVEIVRAKGGPRESEYLCRLRAHPRLRRALLRLGGPGPV